MEKYIEMLHNSKSPAESFEILLKVGKDSDINYEDFKKIMYVFENESK